MLRALAGVYRQFESGKYVSVEGLWMKFSDFSVSNLKLNGNKIDINALSI